MTVKRLATLTLTSLILSTWMIGSAFAFSDLDNSQSKIVNELKDRGVVSGMDNEHFVPQGKLTYAQGVQMIVKGLDLNLDSIQFIKKPLASDTYTSISNDAWYADAFIVAHYNHLEIVRNVSPNAAITREQFADLLVRALDQKGSIPAVDIFIQIKDEAKINPDYQGRIQRSLLYKITELDSEGNFNPKREITRGEAAAWVYNNIHYLEDHS